MFLMFTVFSAPQFVIFFKAFQASETQEPGMISRENKNHYLTYYKNKYLFPLILPNLGHQDFYCQGIYLSELQENFAAGARMAAPAQYDDFQKQIAPAQYDPPPVNKTKMHVKCRRGNIENLLEVGLSSWDSRCPSTSLDDTSNQRKLLEAISADPVCSYRNSPGDANYTQAIVDHFRSISGKSSNYFELNLNTMFSKECYDKILGLNYLQKRLPNFSWKPEIYILVQCLEDGFFNPMTFRNDLTRRDLLHLVLVADCAMVFCFMISVIFLEKMSKRAITEFKDFNNSLETRDFAVQVSGLPKIKDYKHE